MSARWRTRLLYFAGAGFGAILLIAAVVVGRSEWFAGVTAASFDPRPIESLPVQAQRGRAIYAANCLACHGGLYGGGMMDYPPRHNANGHTWHHPDCELKDIVRNGGDEMTAMMRRMMAPPNAPTMPTFRDHLSDSDIDDVLAYIKTLWNDDERAAQRQETLAACPGGT